MNITNFCRCGIIVLLLPHGAVQYWRTVNVRRIAAYDAVFLCEELSKSYLLWSAAWNNRKIGQLLTAGTPISHSPATIIGVVVSGLQNFS